MNPRAAQIAALLDLAPHPEGGRYREVHRSAQLVTRDDGAVRAADAAWVSSERWRQLTEDERETFAPLCPDFVVELRSRSDRMVDLREKMTAYVANGARLGWLIDPYERSVEIYRRGRQVEVLLNPETISGDDVLPGFALELGSIFTR